MNVIILAGGYAQRLWPLTTEFPKTLLSVAGKPVIHFLLENVNRIRGLRSITIAADYEKKAFFEAKSDDINTVSTIIPALYFHPCDSHGRIIGPLAKIARIMEEGIKINIEGNDFLILGGDNVFGFELELFCSYYRKKNASAIAVHRRLEPIDSSEYGVPEIDNRGRVLRLLEKPRARRFSLISTVCYALTRQDAAKIPTYLAQGSVDGLGEFIDWLSTRTNLMSFQFDDEWYDIGARDGLLQANASIMQREQSARKMPSRTRGKITIEEPVYIEDSSDVRDSTIGPNVFISSKTKVHKAHITNSIIYEGCTIRNCTLNNCVIGSGSIVEGTVIGAVLGPKSTMIRE